MSRKAFTEHPEFMRVSKMVNEALAEIASQLGCIDGLHAYSVQTGRAVDDMAKVILRAYDRDQSEAA